MVTFGELGIKKHLAYLESAGFTEPFPIQAQAIPVLLTGRDLIGQAQTGTGKTAAFGLPILEMIDERVFDTQALIIVPTRELAMQVAEEMKKFSAGAAKVTAVYGGEPMLKQIRFLKAERQIVVATPGRLMDYMREDILPLNRVRFVVLDEADRMLDMGFIDDIRKILSQLPQHRQTMMFSATMPNQIVKLAQDFMKNPQRIVVSRDEISNVDVRQQYMEIHPREKFAQLCHLLNDKKKTMIFCGSKMGTRRLAEDLHVRGYEVEAIHGDMEQPQRTRVIGDFKAHRCNILVATDVVARGIDVPTVERVISFDVPRDEMSYFHRIGRTARGGEKGVAIIFVAEKERNDFNAIRSHTKVKIERLHPQKVMDMPIVRGMYGKSFGPRRQFGGGGGPGQDRGRRGFGHGRGGFRHGSGMNARGRGRRHSDRR
jgi:ATP-dependent RNA helicase DeaD